VLFLYCLRWPPSSGQKIADQQQLRMAKCFAVRSYFTASLCTKTNKNGLRAIFLFNKAEYLVKSGCYIWYNQLESRK
jgi:hypothetical protein